MSYLDRDTLGIYNNSNNDGPGPALMGADTLIGDDVYNRDGEDLGDIKEIMLDMRTGEVAYAVLSFGGLLGLGEKLFAVPWQHLTLDTENQRFIVDVDKEHLKNAPGFDKDHWPDMSNADWADEVQTFYGDRSIAGSRPLTGAGASTTAGVVTGASTTGTGTGVEGPGNLPG